MTNPKLGKSTANKEMHYSVGALIKRDGKYLLIDRLKPPFGFAGVAGHVDEGETPKQALIREVWEESGLKVISSKLLFEEELDWNWCRREIGVHYWYLYECEVEGEIIENKSETKAISWYSQEQIIQLKLEEVWAYWFKKLGLLEEEMKNPLKNMKSGMNEFAKRIETQKAVYTKVLSEADKDPSKKVFFIKNKILFNEVIQNFGPILNPLKAKSNLMNLYDIGLHKESGALIISNKGATLYCLSPKTQTPFLTRHIGFTLYLPGLGIEVVNVGIVGDVYSRKFVLRSESACTPSFLYGSQRCNCAHQWASISELAAHFNKINPPRVKNGKEFESWVQKQAEYKNGKHINIAKSKNPGFILMHLDTQNGMGSGYSKDEFAYDLFSRASLRHRGEYSAEQIEKTTMLGGFEAIGLTPDPRKENKNLGYKVAFIILDYLDTNKEIIFLTNNPLKIQHLEKNGYNISRVRSVGMINLAGSQEAEERHEEFHHLDITGKCISFKQEFNRLKNEIGRIFRK